MELHVSRRNAHTKVFEDESLRSLSVEERECILFLDQTLQSLDSDLFDPEQDQSSGLTTPQATPTPPATPMSAPPRHNEHDIIDLVKPAAHHTGHAELLSMPDFRQLVVHPETHFEVKPKRPSTESFPSQYSFPTLSFVGELDGPVSPQPAGSVPTPALIARRLAGGGPLLTRRSLDAALPKPGAQSPPRSARYSGNGAESAEFPETAQRRTERRLPTRSVSFCDPTPHRSRMEALSKLGLCRPEGAAAKPQATGVRRSATGVRRDVTWVTLEGARAKHKGDEEKPEGTGVKPEDAGVRRAVPGVRLDCPRGRHEIPGERSEVKGEKPEETGVRPEATGLKPEGAGVTYNITGVKPQSARARPEVIGVRGEGAGARPVGVAARLESAVAKPRGVTQRPQSEAAADFNSYGGKTRVISPTRQRPESLQQLSRISSPRANVPRSMSFRTDFSRPQPGPTTRQNRALSFSAGLAPPPAAAHRSVSKPAFRPQGITVQFCGRGASETRREALEKLGLLRDTS